MLVRQAVEQWPCAFACRTCLVCMPHDPFPCTTRKERLFYAHILNICVVSVKHTQTQRRIATRRIDHSTQRKQGYLNYIAQRFFTQQHSLSMYPLSRCFNTTLNARPPRQHHQRLFPTHGNARDNSQWTICMMQRVHVTAAGSW